jgi:probable F420-dependent oxidoreductase
MKIRIGYGLGLQGLRPGDGPGEPERPRSAAERFAAMVDALERLRFDSLWLPERITSDRLDPVVALSVAAGRTTKLKLGTSVQVLSGRNPVLLAKEWATLDVLSDGRALPAFGLGVVDGQEQQVFGLDRGERAPWFDEALHVMRRLWTEDDVTHHGERFHLEGITIGPKPVQQPPDVWLGGRAPSELRRVGRVGDGWLPSFATPAMVKDGRALVEEEAARHGRAIDPEHFGVLVPYRHGDVGGPLIAAIAQRYQVEPSEIVPQGFAATRALLERFVDVGFSKFVLTPMEEPVDWSAELEAAAAEVLPLQGVRA